MFNISNSPDRMSSDEQLMLLVGKGNRRAFELLYERYFDKLVWFARTFLNNEQLAEDAVQEIFMKIITNPLQFNTEKKFSTWVYTSVGNSCKNLLRNQKNQERLHNENFQGAAFEHAPNEDKLFLKKHIENILTQLNEKEQRIFKLRFEQDLPIKEIAEILSIPEGSVKSGIYYLLKKMSIQLKEFRYEK